MKDTKNSGIVKTKEAFDISGVMPRIDEIYYCKSALQVSGGGFLS